MEAEATPPQFSLFKMEEKSRISRRRQTSLPGVPLKDASGVSAKVLPDAPEVVVGGLREVPEAAFGYSSCFEAMDRRKKPLDVTASSVSAAGGALGSGNYGAALLRTAGPALPNARRADPMIPG